MNKKKIIFFNIGWMKYYKGINKDDKIEHGGAFVTKNGKGHECCNFLPCDDGYVYGYVQASKNSIRLDQHFETDCDEFINDVIVVWIATDGFESKIIGWYKNATVYSGLQKIPNRSGVHKANGISFFCAKTKKKNAVLLDENKRIPFSKTFRSVWYADGDDYVANQYAQNIAKCITKGDAKIPPLTSRIVPDIDEAEEGSARYRIHLIRERDRKLVEKKKKSQKNLSCEVCNFNFKKIYGENYCEVHHKVPLSALEKNKKTKLSDLAIVCSNCHRMLHHKRREILSIEELRKRIKR